MDVLQLEMNRGESLGCQDHDAVVDTAASINLDRNCDEGEGRQQFSEFDVDGDRDQANNHYLARDHDRLITSQYSTTMGAQNNHIATQQIENETENIGGDNNYYEDGESIGFPITSASYEQCHEPDQHSQSHSRVSQQHHHNCQPQQPQHQRQYQQQQSQQSPQREHHQQSQHHQFQQRHIPQLPPSTVILHNIASYLSLGDAESIASLAHCCNQNNYNYQCHPHPSPHSDHGIIYNNSNSNIITATNTGRNSTATLNSSVVLPGYHSLDHHVVSDHYERNDNDRNNVNGDFHLLGRNLKNQQSSTHNQQNRLQHQQHPDYDNGDGDDDDNDEGWFVGYRQNSSLSLASGPTSITVGTPMTPGLVALSPLEEEWQDGEHHQYQQQQQLQQHQQHQLDSSAKGGVVVGGDGIEHRVWTPAGQATGENEQEHSSSGCDRCDHSNTNLDATKSCNAMVATSNREESNAHNDIVENPSNLNSDNGNDDNRERDISHAMQKEQRQRKQALQHKLAAAVFAHPHPLKDYCLDAYATALKLSMKRQKQEEQQRQRQQYQVQNSEHELKEKHLPNGHAQSHQRPAESPPETLRDRVVSPSTALHAVEVSPELGEHAGGQVAQQQQNPHHHHHQKLQRHHHHHSYHKLHHPKQAHSHERQQKEQISRAKILRVIMSKLLSSVPLSVLLDLSESALDLSLDTLYAVGKISSSTIQSLISILCEATKMALDILTRFNPFHVFEFVLNAQRSAMGKTGEVLVSGIQSVAHGVGYASSAALNNLSRQGLALAGGVVGGSASGLSRAGGTGSVGFGRMRKESNGDVHGLQSKLFRRLHKMDSVSKLVAYSERKDEEALGKNAKKRAQRMMHYNVSFRPFTATIQPRSPKKNGKIKPSVSFEDGLTARMRSQSAGSEGGTDGDDDSISTASLNGSIFMRTPTSFPPTPTSRLYYFERGSRFTENVIFLARDQLRVEGGMGSRNEQTRAMSKALREGSRLAVFDAADAGGGIALSCGQHIATKVGNNLYCSTRSMIPVMRNSYVYFEISVSPPPPCNNINGHSVYNPQMDVTTLSIGLSTMEMPLNTLVGAVEGSVGLCTTGQLLTAGQWFSPEDPRESSYGSNSTVGCLVYLDDRSAFDTREEIMVTADVTFNINGNVVPPAVCSPLLGGSSSHNQCSDAPPPSHQLCDDEDAPTLTMIVPKSQELFPTVTLHSPATCVMCRFHSEDLLATTRDEIGAPLGVTVYSVDGSVILDESSDSFTESDEFDSTSSLEAHDEVTL